MTRRLAMPSSDFTSVPLRKGRRPPAAKTFVFAWSLLVAFLFGGPGRALADTGLCSASTTSLSFGSLSVTSLLDATTSGSATETCPGLLGLATTWGWCASIGAGTNSVSQSNRTMKNGTNSISYQLYTDAGYSIPYQYLGSDLITGPYSTLGGGSFVSPIYAKVLSSAAGLPPGTYTDTYTTSRQAAITSNGGGGPYTVANTCTGNGGAEWYSTLSFMVSVTLSASCAVSATALDFGSAGVIASDIEAMSTVTAQCTDTTPYNIGLDAGTAIGATVSTRKMTGGGATVGYALYSNSGHTTNWGNTVGTDTVSGTGTGSDQPYTVYGVVPAQSTPAPGAYADTITVTVTY
jgi:spore coat protein U-like protein